LVWVDQLASKNIHCETDSVSSAVVAASPGINDAELRFSYLDFLAKK